jgi:hypothetical protein
MRFSEKKRDRHTRETIDWRRLALIKAIGISRSNLTSLRSNEMNTKPERSRRVTQRAITLITLLAAMIGLSTRLRADVQTVGTCNGASVNLPFSDVSSGSTFFCSIAEAYFSALTNGTTATTYSPSDPVTREQMAAFITRTMDQSLKRGSRRAALGQWWTQQFIAPSALTAVGGFPQDVKSDGESLWVADAVGAVSRVRASDGKFIESWSTGSDVASYLLIANGRVYVDCAGAPGKLYVIDPEQPGGNAQFLTTLGDGASGIAFDGEHIMTANLHSITNYHAPSGIKITYTNGISQPSGMLFDGNSFWFTDDGDDKLKKVHVSGQILQVVDVGHFPGSPTFDGTNIWVPSVSSVTVVRASTGQVIATLTGNGISNASAAAFDGQRVLVTNGADSVSLWNASDLKPLGSFPTGSGSYPVAACSDGINFWIVLRNAERLARY